MTTYTLKPLDWVKKPRSQLYNAITAFGVYMVYERGGKWFWSENISYAKEYECGFLWEAKAAAEAHYRERILTALEVVG